MFKLLSFGKTTLNKRKLLVVHFFKSKDCSSLGLSVASGRRQTMELPNDFSVERMIYHEFTWPAFIVHRTPNQVLGKLHF